MLDLSRKRVAIKRKSPVQVSPEGGGTELEENGGRKEKERTSELRGSSTGTFRETNEGLYLRRKTRL